MNPPAHIAAVATLLFIFGCLTLGTLFEKKRNTRRGGLRKWLRVNGILK
jgi:hypothetical protein